MSILGKLAKGTCYLSCGLGGLAIGLTGNIVGGIGKAIAPDSTLFDDIKDLSNKAGNALIDASSTIGNFAESAVDTTFEIAGDIGGGIAGGIADIAGANFKDVEKAKMLGRVVGGAAVGLIVGDVIGTATTTVAGMGTAGTGTSIASLHGAAHTGAVLSNIGGGTLLSGGSGIAGGIQTLNTINAVCTVDGVVNAARSEQKETYISEKNSVYEIDMIEEN